MKLFEKNNQLDEMQEKKLLTVESRGFWGIWGALFAAILIQSAMDVPAKQLAPEFIIFLLACLYMAIETVHNGIWDRHLIPTAGGNIVLSLLGGACIAVYTAVRMTVAMQQLGPWWLIIASALIAGLFTAVLIFILEQIGLVAYRKRCEKLEAENDEENDLEK